MSTSLLKGNSNAWKLLYELFIKYYTLANYGDEPENISKPQQVLCLAYVFDKEVNNGGLDQFFFNSSGNNTHESVGALMAVGAVHAAGILQEAINTWPNESVPKDWEARRNKMEAREEKAQIVWDNCTTQFYKSSESITELLYSYIDSNSEEFGL